MHIDHPILCKSKWWVLIIFSHFQCFTLFPLVVPSSNSASWDYWCFVLQSWLTNVAHWSLVFLAHTQTKIRTSWMTWSPLASGSQFSFSFCYWVVGILFIFWILDLYQIYDYRYFSYTIGCLFTFLIVSFGAQKTLILRKPILSVFNFVVYALGTHSNNSLPNPRLWKFAPTFSSKSFMLLGLTYHWSIELIFICGIR